MTWQPKSSLTVETSHWTSSNVDFKEHGFCASPFFFQTLGPWFTNEIQHLLSSEKRTLDHWATVQFFFSLAQVRCFWRWFCFRSGLVALFLKMSEMLWLLMHWLQLQFTSCEALPSVWIFFAWQYYQAYGHPCCLYTPSYPISFFQSTLHLIFIPYTELIEQPPFSVMTLWYQWLSFGPFPSQQCSPLLWFQRTRDTTMYTVWMVIYWNSNVNIRIFWDTDFWLSLAVSSNNQNEKKNFWSFLLYM